MAPAPAIRNLIVGYPRRLFKLLIHKRGSYGAPANFSSRGSRNALHQIDLCWTLVFRQEFAAVVDQGRLAGTLGFVQNHGCSNFLTQRGMRAAERDRCRDRGMPQQNLIDLVRRDVLASTDDDVFYATGQMQITVVVEKSLVASAKPSVDEGVGVGFGIVFVSSKHVRALDGDLAALIVFERVAVLVHDPDPKPRAHADRPCLPMSRRQRI